MEQWVIPCVIVLLVGSTAFLVLLKLKKRMAVSRGQRRGLDLALVRLTQHLRRNPSDGGAYGKRGIIRYRKGDAKGALADLQRAIDLDESNVEAHYHRGIALEEQDDLMGAAEDFMWIRENSEDPYFKTAVSNRLNKIRARKG